MKRWTTILGRAGTTLIAISLALLLVSLIPQITIATSQSTMSIATKQVRTTSSRVLRPQQGFRIKTSVEGNVNVYLLEVGAEEPYISGMIFSDATELQEFLEANPDLIIWEYELDNEEAEQYFAPTRVMNATLVFYNPSLDEARVGNEVTLTSTVAPGEKVRAIAIVTTPIGVILALPWLVNNWKQRKQN